MISRKALCEKHPKPKAKGKKGKAFPIFGGLMPEIIDGEDARDEVNELSIIATLYDTDNSEVSVFSDSSSSQANGSEADYLNYDSSDDSSSPSWSATSMVAKMSINDHDDNKIKSAVEMNKTEMEAFLGREIEDHQVGVARFEADRKSVV